MLLVPHTAAATWRLPCSSACLFCPFVLGLTVFIPGIQWCCLVLHVRCYAVGRVDKAMPCHRLTLRDFILFLYTW